MASQICRVGYLLHLKETTWEFLPVKEKKPIGNAILTCFNKNQAKERFEKGSEAANAVIAVLNNGTKKQ